MGCQGWAVWQHVYQTRTARSPFPGHLPMTFPGLRKDQRGHRKTFKSFPNEALTSGLFSCPRLSFSVSFGSFEVFFPTAFITHWVAELSKHTHTHTHPFPSAAPDSPKCSAFLIWYHHLKTHFSPFCFSKDPDSEFLIQQICHVSDETKGQIMSF